mmetsp:Transcript_19849/g.25728  ORF Transcript_19849/g.25728 Transcript_19849/m.25728 type:complete len:373 (+) Transcript_19849:56-1174(+)
MFHPNVIRIRRQVLICISLMFVHCYVFGTLCVSSASPSLSSQDDSSLQLRKYSTQYDNFIQSRRRVLQGRRESIRKVYKELVQRAMGSAVSEYNDDSVFVPHDIDSFARGESKMVSKSKVILRSNFQSSSPCDENTLTLNGSGSVIRLAILMVSTLSNGFLAFVGTLRLLAPLIVARRVLLGVFRFFLDYATGRYFRKTYSKLERLYMHYYELPAAIRSCSRCLSQAVTYILLSRVTSCANVCIPTYLKATTMTEDLEGLDTDEVTYFCTLIWVTSIVWIGHKIASMVAIWGGPLRIQVKNHPIRSKRSAIRAFVRPWHILQLMSRPDEWLNTFTLWNGATEQSPFSPNRMLFPATWKPLRLMQILVIARVS